MGQCDSRFRLLLKASQGGSIIIFCGCKSSECDPCIEWEIVRLIHSCPMPPSPMTFDNLYLPLEQLDHCGIASTGKRCV